MNPIKPFSVNTQNFAVAFIALIKSLKGFDRLDHQYTPADYLHQIDAHMTFTLGEQPLNHLAYN